MKILIGCECSGVVRRAFRKRGHDAWSCDLLPAEDDQQFHLQDDVLNVTGLGWDLGIFHPPCRYLSSSGLHWNKRRPERTKLTEYALEFVVKLMNCAIPKIALENPVGCISSRIRKPDQIIQPYQFGDDASKQTCLWLVNLPKLVGTKYVEPRIVNGKKRWSNQTDSGQNKLGPSDTRQTERSRTYDGIADAMSSQWSAQ